MYSSFKSDASEETVNECVFADTLQIRSQKKKKNRQFLKICPHLGRWNQLVIESVKVSSIVTVNLVVLKENNGGKDEFF